MPKKNFKNNPALAFIETQDNTHEEKQEILQDYTHEETQYIEHEITHNNTYEVKQVYTPTRRNYIRTQGRKGYKKPRINLAFDSVEFLDIIRDHAEGEGKSITQFVNDVIYQYIENNTGRRE